jgi:hypothetical protein
VSNAEIVEAPGAHRLVHGRASRDEIQAPVDEQLIGKRGLMRCLPWGMGKEPAGGAVETHSQEPFRLGA